ncbi:helix-turn-helix transcriptional regulator [Amycolatopsis antarctica]|uniref:helix-turn-helix transcriptional regulator n=1 Tax=Amycolatopsis antarctica TaxID=1854586 RepID=UPI0010546DF9|nr:helix-turn-helix transcriptional regulator [Amycolatopsis antarctica]
MSAKSDRELGWQLCGLSVAALAGAVIGVLAFPGAWPFVIAMAAIQLLVTALGRLAPRYPVGWAAALAAVILGCTLTDDRLAELAYTGGIPWIAWGVATGALTLYRNATGWAAIFVGTAALALGLAGVVGVMVGGGVPATLAVLASSVPFLLGVLAAAMLHLRDARADRVRRPEDPAAAGAGGEQEQGPALPGTLDAARRALAIVALRSDELEASAEDPATRRVAADLREVAGRALTGKPAGTGSVARIEIHAPGAGEAPAASVAAPPATPELPELPDREREVLRLVATGASNAAIGRSLYLSEATVKQYVSKLMRRFGRGNRTELAIMASRWFDGA